MAGGGLGNVDPRQQRNPSVASPFGGSMNRPMTQDIMSPSSFPQEPMMPPPESTTVMPPMYGRPMQQPYGFPMPQPYGRPQPQPYQVFPGPMQGPPRGMPQPVMPHSHGENGEIVQNAARRLSDTAEADQIDAAKAKEMVAAMRASNFFV
jgi:hypothetical protein